MSEQSAEHDHEKCCHPLRCAHPKCCGYYGEPSATSPESDNQ